MISKTLITGLVVLSLASCAANSTGGRYAAPIATVPPTAPRQGERILDWPWQESDLRPDANVRYGKLPNGMRYAIRVSHTPTHTASVRMRFDTGSLMEQDDQRGLAHFLEHMAFNGSRNVPEGEMMHVLQRHGLSFGAHTNAYTSFDETVFQLDAPNTEPDTIDTVFMLMREMSSNLTLAPDAMDRERGVVLSEERARNTPDFRAQQAEWDALLPNARFTSRMPIGLVDVIQHAPASLLRDYYEAYYRPERAFFVITGDFDPDAMEAKIRSTFGDWRGSGLDPGDPPLGGPTGGAQAGYFSDPGLPTTVSLEALRPPLREANTSGNVRRTLLRTIANRVVTRRLTRLARATGAHFLSGQASDQEVFDTLAVSSVSVTARPENWQAALQTGEQEIRRALQYGFTPSEVNEQVAQLRNDFSTRAQQSATRTSPALADEIVGEFGQWGVDMDPADELALFEHLAPAFTPAAVQVAFREEWAGVSRRVFLSTSAQIENAPAQELAVLAASERTPVSAPVDTSNVPFAYANFGSAGQVAERHEIADLGITAVRFANNVRLNVKHTDFANDSILVSVRFGGGTLELPASEPGLDMLLSQMTGGGLEAHSADDLQSMLAGRNVGASVYADEDAFGFAGQTTGADLQLELQLMAAYLTHPGYRPEGLERFRQNVAIQYRTLAATPGGVAQRDVPRLLRSGDPRYGIASEAELSARTYDELRSALARASGHAPIEIGIVGDIDVDRAIDLVASTFGALPTRDAEEPRFEAARRLAFPGGAPAAHVLHHQGEPNRALALTYWPTTDDSEPRTQRTLELLRAVLQLKLIERVRESEGATYYPGSRTFFAHGYPGYGYIGVNLDLVPQNVNRFFVIVDQIAASLAAGDISADELERARRPILDEFSNNQEDNEYWLSVVAVAQTDPLALSRHRGTAADYTAVTIVDLRTAARRYLVADRAYRVAILPGPAP